MQKCKVSRQSVKVLLLRLQLSHQLVFQALLPELLKKGSQRRMVSKAMAWREVLEGSLQLLCEGEPEVRVWTWRQDSDTHLELFNPTNKSGG